MAKTFRRGVTGHDKNGIAIVVSDGEATHLLERDTRPGVRLTNFWISDGTPAEYDGPEDTCTGDFVLHPPTNGSVFRCVEFGPEDPEVMAKVAQVRTTGVVWTHQEFSDEVNGVGAVIEGPDGDVLGAINTYGPDYRFPGERDRKQIAAAVLETARSIGDRIGGA